MNKALITALNAQDDVSFYQLEHHIRIARMVREAMIEHAVDKVRMAQILEVPARKMTHVLLGGYDYDLRLLARLQAFCEERAIENAQLKIEAKSYRVDRVSEDANKLVERINKLLRTLENPI
jgi:hypothetical protein